MKPLHKIINTKVASKALHYIKISAGYVYATDGNNAVKIPVGEVFGKNLEIQENEDLYIHADEWKTAKMDKAVRINREGFIFESLDKKDSVLGRAKALTELPNGLHYPADTTLNAVIPQDSPVATVGLPLIDLQAISEILRTNALSLEITAWDNGRALRVLPINVDGSKAVGICMPLANDLPQYFGAAAISLKEKNSEAPAAYDDADGIIEHLKAELLITADELRDAKSRIDELEFENRDLEIEIDSLKEKVEDLDKGNDEPLLKEPIETETATGHQFKYTTENFVDAQIMELFAECLAEIKPLDMLENLRLMKEYKILI